MKITLRTPVQNLREVWEKEGQFSDWLSTPEGLTLITQDIGISVEDARRECRPGNFPCDIVGHLLGDPNHVVVIENQYGRTDHDHLGKMLTYAAVHKALTAVWIAENVADDHRSVIDWLNANTPESVSFYLAELKVIRIGNSDYSPQLDVLCRPNYSVKGARTERTPGEMERREWRKQFWTEIQAAIRAARPPFNLQRPGTDHWSSIAVGRSGFHIDMLLTPRNKSIGVNLVIDVDGWKDVAYRALEDQKAAIEEEIHEPLKWMPLPEKQSARILWEVAIDPDDESNREAVIKWFVDSTIRFYLAFRDRVNSLKAP